MRFLDDNQLDVKSLGKAIRINPYGKGQHNDCFPVIEHMSLIGEQNESLVLDTGVNFDGTLCPRIYEREIQARKGVVAHGQVAVFPECVWEGQTYKNLSLIRGPTYAGENSIGLAFLARHLVTLDFPKGTMYLKRIHDGLPVDLTLEAAVIFLRDLMRRGSVPGWSKDDRGVAHSYAKEFADNGAVSINFDVQKEGDASMYHFTVTRASESSPWKLQKACRTDEKGLKLEEYPVP